MPVAITNCGAKVRAMSKSKSAKSAKKSAPSAAKADKPAKSAKPAKAAKAVKSAKPAKPTGEKTGKAGKASGDEKAAKKAAKKADKKAGKKASKSRGRFDLASRLGLLFEGAEQTAPKMPVKVALFEAERMLEPTQRLRQKLAELPDFDLADADDLPELIDALRRAESAWQDARAVQAEVSLAELRRDAEKLRARMMSSLRYLLRRDPGAQRTLDQIAEGDGIADLCDDLGKLGTLWESRPEAQADIHLGKDAATRARDAAAKLSGGTDGEAATNAQQQRNRVFWALDQATSEVRNAANYLLATEPKKLAAFVSRYQAEKRQRTRANKPTPVTPDDGGKSGNDTK